MVIWFILRSLLSYKFWQTTGNSAALVHDENKNKQQISHRHDSSVSWQLTSEAQKSSLYLERRGGWRRNPQRITAVWPSDILLVCNSHHFPGAPSGGKGGEPILKQCTVNLLWVKKKQHGQLSDRWHYVAFLLFKTHSGLRIMQEQAPGVVKHHGMPRVVQRKRLSCELI